MNAFSNFVGQILSRFSNVKLTITEVFYTKLPVKCSIKGLTAQFETLVDSCVVKRNTHTANVIKLFPFLYEHLLEGFGQRTLSLSKIRRFL